MKQMESTLQALQRPTRYRPQGARAPNLAFRSRDVVPATTQLVGAHSSLEKPRWPRDDTVVSKGNSPEQVGARPCRHCGSPKHWDYECSHARKGARLVKANFASPDDGYMEAQEAYDALYYEDSDTDDPPDHIGESNDASEDQQDFHEPLQSATFSILHANPGMSEQGGLSKLVGSEDLTSSSPVGNSGVNNSLVHTFWSRQEKRAYWKMTMNPWQRL